MKKLIALLLALLFVCALCCAQAEREATPGGLSPAELRAFSARLLEDALRLPPIAGQPDEEDASLYRFACEGYALLSPDSALSADSPIAVVELANAAHPLADMRGIGATHSLASLLAAYPLDNAALRGTYDEAVLYINGLMPDTVTSGRVLRQGARVLLVEHSAYESQGDHVIKSCAVYTIESNYVVAVGLYADMETLTLSAAREELAALSALQEADAYAAYTREDAEPFSREDLTFAGVDFLSGTPQTALNALGAVHSDTWSPDGDGFLRVMQWEGIQIIFRCDGNRENARVSLVQITGDAPEGPRGLLLGDALEDVMARFPQENETGLLYGDGVSAPYGLLETFQAGDTLRYVAQVEEQTILLVLGFIDGRLTDITCTTL